MRAKLHRAWPALSYHFGLRPTDVDDLSAAEWSVYLDALNDLARQAREAQRTR